MLRKLIIFCLILFLFPNFSYGRENSGKLILRKNFDKFSTSFQADYRYDGEDDLNHRHYDLGFKIPFGKGWSTFLNYRSVYKFRVKKNKWELENRPHITLQKTFKTNLAKIQIRTRQEYRYRADDTQSTRNRTRLIVKSQKAFLKLKPFIGNEIFYDMDKEKYNKNRLIGGVSFPKSKFGNYGIYYRHVTDLDSNDNWTSDYGIVLKAIYEF